MTAKLMTRGQLERKLSQSIQGLYRRNLGHKPSKVTCKFFEMKLVIVIENSITSAEQILIEEGKEDLALKVHSSLKAALETELKKLVAEVTKVEAIDILSDVTFATGRTGIIAVLKQNPAVCNPESIPKVQNTFQIQS